MLATINILAGLPRGTGWIVSKISLKYRATTRFMRFKRIVKIVALRSMDIPKRDKYFCKFETTWYNNLASLFKEIIINLSPRKSNKSFANPFQLERTSKTTLRTPTRSTCKYLLGEVTRGVNSKRIRKYPFSSILSSLHVTLLSFSLFSPFATYARWIHYETKSCPPRSPLTSSSRSSGDRESGWDNIFPRLDLIKSAAHGSPALQTSKQKKGWCTPRRPSAARQMQFYASLSLVFLLPCRPGQEILETSRVTREEEMRQFFRQTTASEKNREERRCLFDYGEEREREKERALRLMFARWMERWRLKGGEDLGRNDEFFLEGRNYFVILDNIVGNITCECFF